MTCTTKNIFKIFLTVAVIALFSGSIMSAELFNGKDLDGWYKFNKGRGVNNDPNNVFTVHDGMIHVSGEEYGCITTKKSYENYRLTVTFKWGKKTWGNRKDKGRDSGILIHSFGEDGGFGGIWMKSVEANVTEGGMGDFWIVGGEKDGVKGTCKVVQKGKYKIFDPENGSPVTITKNSDSCFGWFGRDPEYKDVINFRGKNDLDKVGDWNTMTVLAQGDKMTVWYNGTLVNEIYDLGQTSGKIQLQSEGAEIFFRSITLDPINNK